jgi:hypothetical protein
LDQEQWVCKGLTERLRYNPRTERIGASVYEDLSTSYQFTPLPLVDVASPVVAAAPCKLIAQPHSNLRMPMDSKACTESRHIQVMPLAPTLLASTTKGYPVREASPVECKADAAHQTPAPPVGGSPSRKRLACVLPSRVCTIPPCDAILDSSFPPHWHAQHRRSQGMKRRRLCPELLWVDCPCNGALPLCASKAQQTSPLLDERGCLSGASLATFPT